MIKSFYKRMIERTKFYQSFYNDIKDDSLFSEDYKKEIYSRYLKCKEKVDRESEKLTTKAIAI